MCLRIIGKMKNKDCFEEQRQRMNDSIEKALGPAEFSVTIEDQVDSETRGRLKQAGLNYYFYTQEMYGNQPRTRCFFHWWGGKLELHGPLSKFGDNPWEGNYVCPRCGVVYHLPLPEKMQREQEERMKKFRSD
jgi:hypothetical protein